MPVSTFFEDFDAKPVFDRFRDAVRSPHSSNFILDFNGKSAQCAFDLDASAVKEAVQERASRSEAEKKPGTRWINIWCPEKQKTVIEHIGSHYGFSPRLVLSMCCDPLTPIPVPEHPTPHSRVQELLHPRSVRREKREVQLQQFSHLNSDPEKQGRADVVSKRSGLDLNHYRIVNEVWHFMSVDWGYRYTCIGYNSLYNVKASLHTDPSTLKHSRPEGKRVWTWLVLCDDNTVISINENPYPNPATVDERELLSIRRNLINVFEQLSKVGNEEQPHDAIMTVQIRSGLKATSLAETHVSDSDGPSLLLYYLFDDWFTTYSLVARNEHQYGVELDKVRMEMFESAKLEHVHQLHHFGRQLAILKRIYESYNLIIQRITNGPQQTSDSPQRALNEQRQNLHKISDDPQSISRVVSYNDFKYDTTEDIDEPLLDTAPQQTVEATATAYGVPISPAAAVRFERLKDRISLYALSEIRSCLDEKDSLMTLNFNLITIKESSYIERLTRITILLAKVTILFLPVSLMSAYFAVPLSDIDYTVTTYWVTFVIVMTLSFLIIVIFGKLSGTQDAKPIYTSLSRAALEAWRSFYYSKSESKTKKG